MGEYVRLEVDGGIGTIRLDRPKMNALNSQVEQEIRAVAEEAAERSDVRAVIVYGGEKVFAAGADIKEMAEKSAPEMATKERRGLSDALSAVAAIPKPTVAALTGYALGGGFELALTCDRRVAAEGLKVGQPEILLGVIPGAGGTQRLARLVGPSKAKDVIFSGRFVESDEALSSGMVDEVVPAEEVYATARRWAEQFVNGPAHALAAAKRAVDEGIETDLNTGLRIETHLFTSLFATEDQKIGMRSFIENGPGKAEFTGE
ncbi:enoyl-CoA hydratase/isomerase family protein [Actinopolyspora saharensis]|uniref:enoyl-CoA hydratase n=1 Tax=Actinopolyspora saharensis TaxID=995062 RepID=A0A1H1DSP6_9ACTN|nr:enoyl-CoA hydratase-related protein [Actinopolyspora saharensis]SDQ79504.1 short chain enoyl-CoA hydratase [Actinopolyspora saharensis]